MTKIFPLVALFTWLAVTVVVIIAFIRRKPQWIAPALAIIISIATAMLYVPLWYFRTPRIDRLLGQVEEPVHTLQTLATAATLTLALTVLFIVVTWRKFTAAIVTAAIVNAGLLNLFWVVLIIPLGNVWQPVEWDRPDLLVPVRPCRGAIVWAYAGRNYADIGAIDDIWLRFADPRNGRAPTFAVSVSGRWRAEYYWLNSSDLHWMRVRRDDPAVIRCNSRARPESVAPAPWHTLGGPW